MIEVVSQFGGHVETKFLLISAHFLAEECPSSSKDSIQLMHILSVVSRVIDKGGREHQVVKDCRIFGTKVYPNALLAPKGDPL